METRLNMQEAEPQAYKAMLNLSMTPNSISKTHHHLLKIRASQINGCAFCIDMHTKEAMKDGESTQRIFLLNAWREVSLFTEEEKLLLELTEEVTLIHQQGVSSETYQKAEKQFGKNYLAQLIMAIVTINAWNRIAISTTQQPAS
jgi:AhpD family alkylhydroperoxidase